MRVRSPRKIVIAFALFMAAFTLFRGPSFATPTPVTVDNLGQFVVGNDYRAGPDAPLGLTAGHWGNMFNVTIVNGATHTFTFTSVELNLNVTTTLSESGLVYLDLGSAEVSDYGISVRWT